MTEPSEESICIKAELLLMFAARAQHIDQVIKPALNQGVCVVSDRYVDASYAYQGAGRHIPDVWLDQLTAMVVSQCMPDATFVLDVPVSVGMSRIQHRDALDRIEQEDHAFLKKSGAIVVGKREPSRIKVINANEEMALVHQALVGHLKEYIHVAKDWFKPNTVKVRQQSVVQVQSHARWLWVVKHQCGIDDLIDHWIKQKLCHEQGGCSCGHCLLAC